MLGEILNAPPPGAYLTPPATRILPKHLLYSIFARIGGSGLDTDAFETLRASYRGGFLGKAIAYDNRNRKFPHRLFILCAGIRCASSHFSSGLTIMARKKSILIGWHPGT